MRQGKGLSRQSGMTQIAWILALVVFVMGIALFIRLIPPYLENMSVKKSLESIAEDASVKQMSAHKVRELLTRRLYVNNVKSVTTKSLEIVREGQQLSLQMKYEVRVHAIGNADVVLRFDEKVRVE